MKDEESSSDGKESKSENVDKKSDTKSETKEKLMTRKMYYLSCFACRWTSRDVGIPDQTVGKIFN